MKERPKHFVERIKYAYDRIKDMKHGYVWVGSSDYNFEYAEGVKLNTKNLIEEAAHERDITVLDIGTSNGTFVAANDTDLNKMLKHKHKVRVFGISATDERPPSGTIIPNEKYLTGNAEYLGTPGYEEFQTIASQQFDYIFSSKTFMHLVDPVGAIIQAYDKLKPGGILVIDEFTLKGCEGRLQDIVTYLRKQGHCIAVSLNDQKGTIEQFCIKKTSKSLEFPLEYNGQELSYVPSPMLAKDNRSTLEKIVAARTLLDGILEQSGLSLYKEFNSLEALLKSKGYQSLTHKQQEYCILYVVAKELSVHFREEHKPQLGSTSTLFASHSISLQKVLNLKRMCYNRAGEGDRILSGDLHGVGVDNIIINSDHIPLAVRLNLIRLTACQKLLSLDLENFAENAKAFAQMGIQPTVIESYHDASLFSKICKILSQSQSSKPMNVVVGRKFTENSQLSQLSPYFIETLNFMSNNQNKEYICNMLQIKLNSSSYDFTKVEYVNNNGHYFFKLLAESPYSTDAEQNFLIPASQFLAVMNWSYSTIHRHELALEKLPLVFDSPTIVDYLNGNLGGTGIHVLDCLAGYFRVEEISTTEDPDCFKISIRKEGLEGASQEIMISKAEMSELILQQQSVALALGHH
ncbi:Uncharacterised protein [Legionella steigerwaltii]|uniref:Uncharacterized protein n=1 Tax=Legionella steigerwaltii TaxID=460 RepID=A0A378LCB7_9GAMM|nr:class I SAM-dependent methyltransferase [Legionella steigerwaltii]KTD70257.1 hypothetical protein Lstg_3259 [Legionella steigerwaltii]STY23990.1 Uncharacterised protein [Legionella steigerwaltii]